MVRLTDHSDRRYCICTCYQEDAGRKAWLDRLRSLYIPGEDELLALAQGGLRVIRGEEAAKEY